MPTTCERRLIVIYLANAAARLHHRDGEAAALAEWAVDRDNRSAYESKSLFCRLVQADIEHEERITARQLRNLRQALREECAAMKRTKFDRTALRLRCLGEATGLSPTDVDILELLAALPDAAGHRVDGRRGLRSLQQTHDASQRQGGRPCLLSLAYRPAPSTVASLTGRHW